MSTAGESDQAPGWDAIDRALRPIYGDVEPAHWGTVFRWRLGGPDPLDGISAYPRDDPVPHWHYVSYGMSELYTKESDNPEISGWGFEFTFRLTRDPTETEAPVWAAQFLQNLARYVFQSGNAFAAGDVVDANGPIALERHDSLIRAVAFTLDPELDEIATPHGRVRFLQAVGLAGDEYAAAQEWDTGALLNVLAPRTPLFVTDIDRGSLLEDPAIADEVRAGSTRDGSSTDTVLVRSIAYTRDGDASRLRLSSEDAPRIARMLAARLPYGRGLLVRAPDRAVEFRPGDRFTIAPGDDTMIEITVPPDAVNTLVDALRTQGSGQSLPSLPGLSVEFEAPQQLADPDESDLDDLFTAPPGDQVFGLVEPDLGEGVCAQAGGGDGGWAADLFYGDPLSLHGPFVWVRTALPTAESAEPSLSLMLLSEHRRLVEHAWLGDAELTVTPEPAVVRLVVGTEQLTADALIEGDLLWVLRTAAEDATVVTVIGRGVDIGRIRLRPVGDLSPYEQRRSELYDRLSAALHNRPDPPNPALDGNALDALRAAAKEKTVPYSTDEILAGTVDWSTEPMLPPPANREELTGHFGDTITRDYEQAVRELQRANDVDRQTAEWWVSSATEHVDYLTRESFFDRDPDLRERACEETLRYYAHDEKVSSHRAQNAWAAWRDHRFELPDLDDAPAWEQRQQELENAWRAEWQAWVAAQSAGQ